MVVERGSDAGVDAVGMENRGCYKVAIRLL